MGFKIGLKMNLNYLFVKTLLMDGEFQRTVGTELQKRVWHSVAIDRAQRGDKRPVACSSGRADVAPDWQRGRYM